MDGRENELQFALAACYVITTDDYDKRLEAVAEAEQRPVSAQDVGAMSKHAVRVMKIVEQLAQEWGFTFEYHYLSPARRWNISDLKAKLYGTAAYNRFRDAYQVSNLPKQEKGRGFE